MGETQQELVEVVPAALAGERIDRLVSLAADVSRNRANELIGEGAVLINGRPPAKASERVVADDTVKITVVAVDTTLKAEPDIPVAVLYSDDDVIVVNKPPGLVVHPGSGVADGTLVNALLARFPEIRGVGQVDRPGIVHRLDKGTSGLLMVARSEAGYESLTGQLGERSVTRRYLALVDGVVEAEKGLVDAPLGRSNRQPTLRAVIVDGRPARTHYQVLERLEPSEGSSCTLVACRLETGRTHQIRVHMAAIGHPVIADHRYGAPSDPFGLQRPFLHAEHLGFDHPSSGKPLSFDAPLPDDLSSMLLALRSE